MLKEKCSPTCTLSTCLPVQGTSVFPRGARLVLPAGVPGGRGLCVRSAHGVPSVCSRADGRAGRSPGCQRTLAQWLRVWPASHARVCRSPVLFGVASVRVSPSFQRWAVFAPSRALGTPYILWVPVIAGLRDERVIYTRFLPVYHLSFHSSKRLFTEQKFSFLFHAAKTFNFDKFPFIKPLPNPRASRFSLLLFFYVSYCFMFYI